MTPCPAIERGAGGFQRASPLARDMVKNGVFVNISDVPANSRDYCQPLHLGCLGLVESGLGLVESGLGLVESGLGLFKVG